MEHFDSSVEESLNFPDLRAAPVKTISENGSWVWHEKLTLTFLPSQKFFSDDFWLDFRPQSPLSCHSFET